MRKCSSPRWEGSLGNESARILRYAVCTYGDASKVNLHTNGIYGGVSCARRGA